MQKQPRRTQDNGAASKARAPETSFAQCWRQKRPAGGQERPLALNRCQLCVIGASAAATKGSLRSTAGLQVKPFLRWKKETMKVSMAVILGPAAPGV